MNKRYGCLIGRPSCRAQVFAVRRAGTIDHQASAYGKPTRRGPAGDRLPGDGQVQATALYTAILGIILVWLALCDAVTRFDAVDRRLTAVYGWSRRVIAMYFRHWVIVGWGVGLVGFRTLDQPGVLVTMTAAVVLTTYLSRFAVRLEARPWLRGRAPSGTSEVAVEVEPATA